MVKIGLWISISAFLAASLFASDASRYNVVWRAPSRDSQGSMPLGNGDVGLNAWVEPDGDLRF